MPPADDEPSVPAPPVLSGLSDLVASDFVPAEALALRPAATSDVVIPYPDGPEVSGRISVPLTLFIDENGVVVRVWVEGADIPERFLDAATAAFQDAVFSPGQTATGAVKSKIRLEVAFDVNEG